MTNYKIVGYVRKNGHITSYIREREIENKDIVFQPSFIKIDKTVLDIKNTQYIIDNIINNKESYITKCWVKDAKVYFDRDTRDNLIGLDSKYFRCIELEQLTDIVNQKLKKEILKGSIEEIGDKPAYYLGRDKGNLEIIVSKMINERFSFKAQRLGSSDNYNLLNCCVKDFDTLVKLVYEFVR